ncbi:hypothetical protein B0I35DRAFT_426064 [Stachybotrys elegans]|uniref:Uncharacterized protein n=1 Tax=Stachybotrys elegans TaxID=80388 RepID=A0A8K0WSU0_9HYPO|nr:hypothetical protein B0I35DRAFT_426064 [Stachybotrys elegans]
MSHQWRVGSYFINVGLGDGAIHLLLDESKTNIREKVVSAVLIDGGLRGGEQVKWTAEHIMTQYEFTGDKADEFWFRAVVITHWDRDHYEAAMCMFQASFSGFQYQRCRWIRSDTVFYLPKTGFSKRASRFSPAKVYSLNKSKNRLCIDEHELCDAVFGHKCLGKDLFSGQDLGKGTDENNPLSPNELLANCQNTDLKSRPLLLCWNRLQGDEWLLALTENRNQDQWRIHAVPADQGENWR